MPTIPKTMLMGNWAEAVVSARLSDQCLVRPVPGGTDVGVDLYCETLASNGRPFLHFWLQIKSGNQCKRGRDGHVRCTFKASHLDYWERQPVPVFAALVPTKWPPAANPTIYIVDVTAHVVAGRPHGAKKQTLVSTTHWPAGDQTATRTFLNETVPRTTALLQCKHGVIPTLPTPTPEYVRKAPRVPAGRYVTEIRRQMRHTSSLALSNLKQDGDPDRNARRRIARVLATYDDDGHWETHATLAWSAHMDRQWNKAVKLYERARRSIRDDKNNLLSDSGWKWLFDELKHELDRAKARQAPASTWTA